ncbi:isochorismatase family protein [Streptomyces sp. 4503]|uniref:Isochorismatase family protein n=1 Tax=Streptomyces niphimycinicus TaxID=2842201 RepID=A0ABS6CIZ3_9ACTN|nr:isochorismatase family protein [Streptomyces niphimycinicus]MBU3866921.1 isochorismatase family protein [Streptomyces niphimycinicus]
MSGKKQPIYDASECMLALIDYQDGVLDLIFEQDRRIIELNARYLAKFAQAIGIPVVLSTVGVEMGVNGPTISTIRKELPDVEEIDRSQMNAWEDAAFVDAVKATGRKKVVMAGIVTSVCLTFPAIDAMADGYQVAFVADAVGDATKEIHDTSVLRLVQAGAAPVTTIALMAEWFRDWKSPLAEAARELWVPYKEEWAAYKRDPQFAEPKGLV